MIIYYKFSNTRTQAYTHREFNCVGFDMNIKRGTEIMWILVMQIDCAKCRPPTDGHRWSYFAVSNWNSKCTQMNQTFRHFVPFLFRGFFIFFFFFHKSAISFMMKKKGFFFSIKQPFENKSIFSLMASSLLCDLAHKTNTK